MRLVWIRHVGALYSVGAVDSSFVITMRGRVRRSRRDVSGLFCQSGRPTTHMAQPTDAGRENPEGAGHAVKVLRTA